MAYYDYDEDRELIKGAFCSTFMMKPDEFEDLSAKDYFDLFPSLSGDSTFVNLLRVRMETDTNKIKDFTKSEYAEWVKWQQKKKRFEKRQEEKNKPKIEERKKERAQKLLIAQQKLQELMGR